MIMIIVALALHDHAFDAACLTDAYSILSKDVWGPTECMPIRWKKDKLKVPLFRHIKGAVLSEDKAMLYTKLLDDIRRQSLESGHEKAWMPKVSRRGAGNAANGMLEFTLPRRSSMLKCVLLGDATDSVRDQIMQHEPGFKTFFSAYLNENANFDLQNAFLEEEKQSQLFHLFAHIC